MEKIGIIGAGFGGLSTAVLLADKGYDVTVFEKNETPGGRARGWTEKGYTFDMGPSWYLMPEVFDDFFKKINRKREDYFDLHRLDPYYRVFFEKNDPVDITADIEKTKETFNMFEENGGQKLTEYLENAQIKYDTAIGEFLYRDYSSMFDFMNPKMLLQGTKLSVFSSLDKMVSKYFDDHRAKKILEYAMVFLGNSPHNAPALYSMMSHIDLNLGVWFPKGGIVAVVDALVRLCEEFGVTLNCGEPVTKIETTGKRATALVTEKGTYQFDTIISNSDYAHSELDLLDNKHRTFDRKYWEKKVFAPSMFIMYLGVNKPLNKLEHHNLYFAHKWDEHFAQIFDNPSWPENPSWYLSRTSKSDKTAPDGCETLFLLVPVAPGLEDSDELRESYAQKMLKKVEEVTGEEITPHIEVQRIFSHRDFTKDYNAWKGTALGLAHTLDQTAVFRPARRSKKVENLYFCGQYTHPGVGVPMTFIAAELTKIAIAEK